MSSTKSTVHVTERYTLDPKSKVNRDDCTISDVKLLGWASRNNARYDKAAFSAVAAAYDGAKIKINHGSKTVESVFGRVHGVYPTEDGLYAKKIKYNPKLPMTEGILWFAENDPSAIGMSHDALVTKEIQRDGSNLYTGLVKLNSVDLVSDPATTNGVFESMNPDGSLNDVKPQGEGADVGKAFAAKLGELLAEGAATLPHDQFREITKHLLNAHGAAMAGGEEEEGKEKTQESVKAATENAKATAELRKQLADVKSRLEAYEVKEQLAVRVATARKLCSANGLPAHAVTEHFVATLAGKSEAEQLKDIADRKTIMLVRESDKPISSPPADGRPIDMSAFTKFVLTGKMQ